MYVLIVEGIDGIHLDFRPLKQGEIIRADEGSLGLLLAVAVKRSVRFSRVIVTASLLPWLDDLARQLIVERMTTDGLILVPDSEEAAEFTEAGAREWSITICPDPPIFETEFERLVS